MTCKNIRTGKTWMTPEIQAANQLKWANEVPGNILMQSVTILTAHAHTSIAKLSKMEQIYTCFR